MTAAISSSLGRDTALRGANRVLDMARQILLSLLRYTTAPYAFVLASANTKILSIGVPGWIDGK